MTTVTMRDVLAQTLADALNDSGVAFGTAEIARLSYEMADALMGSGSVAVTETSGLNQELVDEAIKCKRRANDAEGLLDEIRSMTSKRAFIRANDLLRVLERE